MPLTIKLLILLCAAQWPIFADEWNTVYLASFPRSGNHWVRFLVEEATHIATSSVYRDGDYPHLHTMFPWGGYCTDHGYEGLCRFPTNDDPVLIKTHYPNLPRKIDPEPKRTICLIRHPVDAFWSFSVYKRREETSQIDKAFLKELIGRWQRFYEFWENQSDVLFVRYEDLHAYTEFYLGHILQAAGFSFDMKDVERAVTKYPPQGAPLKHINHYDAEALEMIKTELTPILERFNYDI